MKRVRHRVYESCLNDFELYDMSSRHELVSKKVEEKVFQTQLIFLSNDYLFSLIELAHGSELISIAISNKLSNFDLTMESSFQLLSLFLLIIIPIRHVYEYIPHCISIPTHYLCHVKLVLFHTTPSFFCHLHNKVSFQSSIKSSEFPRNCHEA